MKTTVITEADAKAAATLATSGKIHEAVSQLIANIKSGDSVTCIEGVPHPCEGIRGVVRDVSEGFATVEYPNGAKYKVQQTLLLKV